MVTSARVGSLLRRTLKTGSAFIVRPDTTEGVGASSLAMMHCGKPAHPTAEGPLQVAAGWAVACAAAMRWIHCAESRAASSQSVRLIPSCCVCAWSGSNDAIA